MRVAVDRANHELDGLMNNKIPMTLRTAVFNAQLQRERIMEVGLAGLDTAIHKEFRNGLQEALTVLKPMMPPPPGSGFSDVYDLADDELGKGAYAIVRTCTRKSDGKKFAAKCVDIKRLKPKEELSLLDEVNHLRQLDHPFIMKVVV